MSHNPRFSIVIPTRESADTIGATLRTCLNQTYDDYEIVFSDNFSDSAVREIVHSFDSPKIRYFRTPKRLPITVHWDFAVSQARGQYVLAVGADDGLLFHALAAIDDLLRQTQVRVVRWQRVQYTWPSYICKADANLLWIPLTRYYRHVEGREMIRRVLALEIPYTDLPMMYNACVERSVLETLREKTGGLFFGRAPDVYSAFAIPYLSGPYLTVDAPMSINAGSGNSNGAAHLFEWDRNPVAREFDDLNRTAGIEPHPWIPELLHLPDAPFADGFLRVKERLFPDDDSLTMDRKLFASRWVEGIRARSETEWHAVMTKIRATFKDSPDLESWFDKTYGERPPVVNPMTQVFSSFRGFDGESLTLPADQFGVSDVFGAASLCEQICRHTAGRLDYCVPSFHEMRKERDQLREECTYQREALQHNERQLGPLSEQLRRLETEYEGLRQEFSAYKARRGHRIVDGLAEAYRWFRKPHKPPLESSTPHVP